MSAPENCKLGATPLESRQVPLCERPSSMVAFALGVLVALCAGAAGCQQAIPTQSAVAVPATNAPNDASVAQPASGAKVHSAPLRGAIDPWARWPMPNARLPGLPNRHAYDTATPGVVVDRVSGLMWQRRLPNTFLTRADAERQCDGLVLGGHHDWRLPSRIELVSLIDTTRTQPSIDVEAFPSTPSDWFWTSSLAVDDPSAAWYVYFYFGYPKTDDMTSRFSVRCVRSNRLPGSTSSHYEIQADEVRDIGTGLRWQRTPPSKSLTFEAARSYCHRLTLRGTKGWRVPTLGELLTLIDERASAPMVDGQAFPGASGEPFWTSSAFANGNELAWYVRFDKGNGLYGRPTEPFRVRCVR